MPLFEFICKKCSEKFETLIFSKEKIECPKCKSSEVVKQLSNFSPLSSSSSLSSNCATADFCPSSSPNKSKCPGGCCHH
ncbi:MAG: zinc ribbon domain-containing protein [Endomicrobium sp.]|nr:zinc ribbon domain-containing protein [Endomicrobium sp.]